MSSKTRSPQSEKGARIGPVIVIIFIVVALLPAGSALYSAGIVDSTDTAMLFLAVAAAIGLWLHSLALRSGRLQGRIAWRVTLTLLAGLALLLVLALFSEQHFVVMMGAPAVSTGVAQLGCLIAIAIGASFSATVTRTWLLRFAPWILLFQIMAATWQSLTGAHPGGTLTNSSFLGQFILLLLPLTFGSLYTRGGRWKTVAWAVPLVTIGALLAFGSYLAAALAALFLLWAMLRLRIREWWVGKGDAVTLAVTGLLILVLLLPVVIWAAGPQVPVGELLATRPYLWDGAVTLIAESPVTGHGLNSYRTAVAPVIADEVMAIEGYAVRSFGSLAGDPHNLVLEILVSAGLVGLMFFGWLLFEVLRNWRLQAGTSGKAPNWFAVGALLMLLSAALAPLPLQTLAPMALVIGASLRPETPKQDSALRVLRRVGAAPTQWTLLVVTGLLVAATMLYAGTRLWIGMTPVGVEQAQRSSSAGELWRGDAFLAFWEARQWVSGGVSQRAVQASARAVELEPDNAMYWIDHARWMGLYYPEDPATERAYARAEELFGASVEVHLYHARYLIERDDLEGAATYIERALDLAPNDPEVLQLADEFIEEER